jgi:hypothetical protein
MKENDVASQFERAARFQTILVIWTFAMPMFGLLLYALTQGADHTTVYFWAGLAGMISGYALLVRSKWDQIQSGDFFTWGLSPSARKLRPVYIASYLFMTCGFILAGVSGTV